MGKEIKKNISILVGSEIICKTNTADFAEVVLKLQSEDRSPIYVTDETAKTTFCLSKGRYQKNYHKTACDYLDPNETVATEEPTKNQL